MPVLLFESGQASLQQFLYIRTQSRCLFLVQPHRKMLRLEAMKAVKAIQQSQRVHSRDTKGIFVIGPLQNLLSLFFPSESKQVDSERSHCLGFRRNDSR